MSRKVQWADETGLSQTWVHVPSTWPWARSSLLCILLSSSAIWYVDALCISPRLNIFCINNAFLTKLMRRLNDVFVVSLIKVVLMAGKKAIFQVAFLRGSVILLATRLVGLLPQMCSIWPLYFLSAQCLINNLNIYKILSTFRSWKIPLTIQISGFSWQLEDRSQNTYRSIFHSGFLLFLQCSLCYFQEMLCPTHWINVLTIPIPECQEAEGIWNSFQAHMVKGSECQHSSSSPKGGVAPCQEHPPLLSTLSWYVSKIFRTCLSPSFSWLPIGGGSPIATLKVPRTEHTFMN